MAPLAPGGETPRVAGLSAAGTPCLCLNRTAENMEEGEKFMTNYAALARRWVRLEPEPVFLVAIESEAGVQTTLSLNASPVARSVAIRTPQAARTLNTLLRTCASPLHAKRARFEHPA